MTAVADGRAAIDRASTDHFDIVLLDVALGPGPDGYEVCRTLRARRNVVPIIMLTALDSEADAVLGLEAGGDDYVTKPFGLAELRSRIRAVLRRAGTRAMGSRGAHRRADRARPRAARGDDQGRPVRLTFCEFELLDALMADPGRLLNRQELLRAIWGDSAYRDPRAIDVHIRHLREKLEPEPEKPRYILTVRGAGYRLRGPVGLGGGRTPGAADRRYWRIGALGLRGRIVGVVVRHGRRDPRRRGGGAARPARDVAAQRRADDVPAGHRNRLAPATGSCSGLQLRPDRGLSYDPGDHAAQLADRQLSTAETHSPTSSGPRASRARLHRCRSGRAWRHPGGHPEGSRVDDGDGVRRAFRARQAAVRIRDGRRNASTRARRYRCMAARDAVLAVRKSIDEIPGAVRAVALRSCTPRSAGLALTLILAIPLSATLVRRLRQLREAALQLALTAPALSCRSTARATRSATSRGPSSSCAAAAPAGGGPPGVRRHRVARAAHAADLARWDARAARRRSARRRARPRGRAGAARARPRAVDAGSGGWPPTCSTSPGSTLTWRCAPSRSSSAS